MKYNSTASVLFLCSIYDHTFRALAENKCRLVIEGLSENHEGTYILPDLKNEEKAFKLMHGPVKRVVIF